MTPCTSTFLPVENPLVRYAVKIVDTTDAIDGKKAYKV
jgi:hypothetical protein